jgi:two-component system sensor histidine kinase UhpB
MRRPSLLSQILALNLLMVTAGILVSIVAGGFDFSIENQRWQFLVLALTLVLTFLLNTLLLRRRFEPLERLLAMMERVDLSRPGRRLEIDTDMPGVSTDIVRLAASFNRMLERLENERRRSGEMVIGAQEEERKRIARDLHDEVNQSLTALLLRIEAAAQDAPASLKAQLAQVKELADQAMGELLDLARQLRPTALDDHGLVPALTSQVADFGDRTGIRASFRRHGTVPPLSDEEQLVIYRVTQESLSNVAQHSGARHVDVELSFVGRTVLRVRDDGYGFKTPANGRARLGVSGMRERALLVGGHLTIFSEPGDGTTIELTMGAT